MKRRHALILPLLVGGLFLAAEVALRLTYFGLPAIVSPWNYTPFDIVRLRLTQPVESDAIQYKLKPNLHTFVKGRRFTTNSDGFRERELPREKPPGVYRIVVLGASYCMGSGVGDDEMYSRRLQARLDAVEPGRFEVLNFAVSGYRIEEMLATYELFAKPYEPDAVLMPIFPQGRQMPRRQRIAKSGPITGLTKLTYVRPKLDYSFAYQAARHVLADWMPSHLSVDWASRGRPKQRPPGGLLEVFAPFFTARARDGVEVFLAAIPTLSESRTRQISRRADQARLWTRQFRNVHLIDVRRTLWPRIQPDDYIYFGDRHLNARAHDEIAAAIFDRLHPLLLALRQGERRTKLAGRSPWWRPSAAPPE